MKTITEMIQQFKFFSTFNDIPAIITLLELIESDSEGKQATIESLRIELRKSEESCLEMTGYEMSIGELSLNKVIHDALLTLAAYSPLNDVDEDTLCPLDPISYQIIDSKDMVAASTGYLFDINRLVHWHNTRPLNKDEQKRGKKEFLDPMSATPFSTKDREYINEVALKIQLTIDLGSAGERSRRLATRDEIQQIVSQYAGLLDETTLDGVSRGILDRFKNPACVNAIRNGLFGANDLKNMDSHFYSQIKAPETMGPLTARVFSFHDISHIGHQELRYISFPETIDALLEGRTTIEQLSRMSIIELDECIESGQYPAPPATGLSC